MKNNYTPSDLESFISVPIEQIMCKKQLLKILCFWINRRKKYNLQTLFNYKLAEIIKKLK